MTPSNASPSDFPLSSTRPTVRMAVLKLLRELGMTTVFGNPGSTELPMFLDFPDDFRYVLGLQEAVVVGMADGYAQATRNAAFVNLHSAAGVGNAMGNIFTAYKNCTPLVITAGQQARSMLPFDPFLFSGQAAELPKPYVKWSCEPARAQDVPLALARAYYTAMQAPAGPVLVSIPADDWLRTTDWVEPRQVSTTVRAEPALLGVIGQALDDAHRPAIVVGAGVARDAAVDAVVALAERHNAQVWVAPMSARCGFPEEHPLFGGFLPALREKIVALLQGHDVILALGAPAFIYHVEGSGPHVPAGARLYQLVDDPELAAWTPVGTSAVGNVGLGVHELLERAVTPHVRARAAPPARAPRPRVPASNPMTVAYALQTLNEVRGHEDIVVEEAPSSRPLMQAQLPMRSADAFHTMASGGLGHGMPAAVGVALAAVRDKPGARVIALIGDGSAMYSIQAIWSAAQLKLPMTFVILNNRRYAALQDFAPVFGFAAGAKPAGTELPDLDFVALAKGQGCDGVRVTRPEDLAGVLRGALRSPAPILVDVIVQ